MNALFRGVYKNRKVLVTGHTGFKGSWLCTWLVELGADVVGYALEPNTSPSMFEVCKLEKKITNITGDMRNFNYLSEVINKFQPEIIFHLAAQPLVRESYIDPKTTYDSNVIGTLNLYEACRRCQSVKVIICVTTDKCYENKEWVYGYRESDRLGGYDPYSSSKTCVEILTESYKKSFFNDLGIQIATVRSGNVIGGGDWSKDRLIPDSIRYLNDNQPILIRNPTATRPWQYVLEPLSGYLWLGCMLLNEPYKYNTSWNFGPYDDANQNVESIVKKIIKYWGKGNYIVDNIQQPHETQLLKLDISKAKKYLKWYPVYDFQTAVKNTVDWYKAYSYQCNMNELTLVQIIEYVSRAKELEIVWSI